jgi:hypothetical protein
MWHGILDFWGELNPWQGVILGLITVASMMVVFAIMTGNIEED